LSEFIYPNKIKELDLDMHARIDYLEDEVTSLTLLRVENVGDPGREKEKIFQYKLNFDSFKRGIDRYIYDQPKPTIRADVSTTKLII
jgi:hypothetical protein